MAQLMAVFALGSCTKAPDPNTSQVLLKFPSSTVSGSASEKSESQQSVSALSYNWSQACFLVNITAADLPTRRPSNCDLPMGVFAGTVAPGGSLSINVPRGFQRRLEVYVYNRPSTEPSCPANIESFAALNLSRVVRVGSVASFDTNEANVDVDVTVQAPSAGVTLISQEGLPTSCAGSTSPSLAGRVPASTGIGAWTRHSGGGVVLDGGFRAENQNVQLQGAGIKVDLRPVVSQ